MPARLVTFTLVASLVALSGCLGESGESCKATTDCKGSLVCCNLGTVVSGGARGVCQADCTSATVDAGP